MAHRIIIKVKSDGAFIIEIQGIKGEGCATVAKLLEKVGKVVEDKPTNEFYEQATGDETQTVSV